MPTTSSTSADSAPSQSRRSSIMGKSKRAHREVRFGSYVLGSTLGEGEFGKVKLGWRKDGKTPSQAAIKLIRRDSIPRGSERESKVYREINSLKRLAHPNIVRLEEVLQNDKYIGIVLEYASGGELFDYILEHRYLKDAMACKLFSQLISGVDYMHSKGIVHRDLKLENLLLDKHKNIVISDFGFVNSFRDGNELMKTSCGSPCYAAPELVVSSEPYEARKVDVWSCGVILYAMLAGYLPFDDDPQNPDGDNIARLYHYITHTPLTFPEYVQPMPRDLLRKIIVSNPKKRLTLREARAHSWLSPHAPFLSVTPQEWDKSYRSARSRLHSSVDNANRRHSLMEGNLNYMGSGGSGSSSSSAAFLLNSSHARSYSTQNVSQQLYSHPAAPQTSSSHAIATIPISASSHEIATMSANNNANTVISSASHSTGTNFNSSTNSNNNGASPSVILAAQKAASLASAGASAGAQPGSSATETPSSPLSSTSSLELARAVTNQPQQRPPLHTRTNSMSSASLALQAVVQADVEERSHMAASSELHQPQQGQQQQHQHNKRTSMLPPSIAPRPLGTGSSNGSTRLPGPHVKPRPTSFHPGLYSSGNTGGGGSSASTGGDVYSLLPFHLTSTSSNGSGSSPTVPTLSKPSSQSRPPIPPTNTRQQSSRMSLVSSTASSVIHESPTESEALPTTTTTTTTREKRNSWSKISEPSVDMSSASGMLSPGDKSEKRKSVALDSLSNAIESLSRQSTKDEEQLKDSEVQPTSSPAKEEKVIETTQAEKKSTDDTKAHLKKSELESKPEPEQEPVAPQAKTSSLKPAVVTHAATKKTTQYDKENKENSKPVVAVPTASNRSKRFSFFYTSSTPAATSTNSQQSQQQQPLQPTGNRNTSSNMTPPGTSSTSSNTGSSTSTPSRKILEPSNDVNIMKMRTDDFVKHQPGQTQQQSAAAAAAAVHQNRRFSMIVNPSATASAGTNSASSRGDNGNILQQQQPITRNKESSAAKKVVDFFKRRSMRV